MAFNVRIQLKRDTSANWTTNNPVLLDGEIIIVDTDAGEVRYKVGDGTKTYTQLPFDDEVMKNLVNSKQDKIQGDPNQVVVFDGDGNAVGVDGVDKVIEINKGLTQQFWRGTKEEFDAIETKDDNVMYLVIDDEGAVGASGVDLFLAQYDVTTGDEILEAYNAGKTIIATVSNRTCFLSEYTNGVFYFRYVAEDHFGVISCYEDSEPIWSTSTFTHPILEHSHEISEIDSLQDTLDAKQAKITGNAGDFVVIGADGNVATKTIANAEEASF